MNPRGVRPPVACRPALVERIARRPVEHSRSQLCASEPLDVRITVEMREGVVTDEDDIKGRRAHRQRAEVGDQRHEWQIPRCRFASGPVHRASGDIRAGDTKPPCQDPERLRADAERSVRHDARGLSPVSAMSDASAGGTISLRSVLSGALMTDDIEPLVR